MALSFRPTATVALRTRPCAAAVSLRPSPTRRSLLAVVVRATPSEEGMKEETNPYEVPQTGRTAPMSEDKHADTPEQMAAPEGDRAIAGQAWQPTKQDGETPEDRYGSTEAYEEAMEAHKDKSKKSEVQTGDLDGNYGNGGA